MGKAKVWQQFIAAMVSYFTSRLLTPLLADRASERLRYELIEAAIFVFVWIGVLYGFQWLNKRDGGDSAV